MSVSVFDRELLKARRTRTAARFATADFLLDRVAEDFAARLALINREFALGANVGCHNGVVSRCLRALPSVGRLIDVDSAEAMVAETSRPADRLVADEEALCFGDGVLDLIVSGLSLHAVNDLPGMLAQARRALRPDGLLMAAMLGGQTLQELRQAWLVAESDVRGGGSPRVAPFADVRDFGSLLQRAEFALPVVDSDVVEVTYADPIALMRELRTMGAGNVLVERSRVPVTRQLLMRVCEVYADQFSNADGRIVATFEILTATAWAPHASQQKPLKPGSAAARLADALGTQEQVVGGAPKKS